MGYVKPVASCHGAVRMEIEGRLMGSRESTSLRRAAGRTYYIALDPPDYSFATLVAGSTVVKRIIRYINEKTKSGNKR